MTPLERLIERILDDEGGIKDVGDGKGVTRFGQTPDWLARFNFTPPRTRGEAALNYLTWIGLIKFHPLVDPGDDLADILIDIAVMSDHSKAVKALQASLGFAGQDVDGALGSKTLTALAAASRRQLARDVIAWDMSYQGRLITMNPGGRAQYAAGWANRMAKHVRRLA